MTADGYLIRLVDEVFDVQAVRERGRRLSAHEVMHAFEHGGGPIEIDARPVSPAEQKTIIGGFKSMSGMDSAGLEIAERRLGGRSKALTQWVVSPGLGAIARGNRAVDTAKTIAFRRRPGGTA